MNTKNSYLRFLGFRPTGDLDGLTIYTTKRRKTVFYNRAPPTKPPTVTQRMMRSAFRTAALAWQGMPPSQRANWHKAASKAHLYLNGYTLWTYWCTKRDQPTIRTIQHQSGVNLL